MSFIIPELFLREPKLAFPNRKPLTPVIVDAEHELGAKCKVAHLLSNGVRTAYWHRNWGKGQITYELNAGAKLEAEGVSSNVNASCLTTIQSSFSQADLDKHTYAIRWRRNNGLAGDLFNYYMYCENFQEFSFYINTVPTTWYVHGTAIGTVPSNLLDGLWHQLVLSVDYSTPRHKIWMDGVFQGTESATVTGPAGNEFNLGGRDDDNRRYSGGDVGTFYVFDGELSDDEVYRLSKDFYQFILPR